MQFVEYVYLVNFDLWRYCGSANVGSFLRSLFRAPGFAYTFWMRTCRYSHRRILLRYGCDHVAKLILWHCTYKYGISLEPETHIGSGIYIGHFGGIVVSPDATIGDNCNLSQGVTIGKTYRGARAGVPVIGDNV